MVIRHFDEDTIAAVATPPGEGGIGIVRLSGPAALRVADRLFRPKHGVAVEKQRSFSIQYGHAVSQKDSGSEKIIDEVLLSVMRAPKSYTGEDVVEISAHGGPAVLAAILDLVCQEGARLAQKGEFTKRAFLNGKMDLLQAEAVLDLVRAKTQMTHQWAMSQLEGVFSGKVRKIKDELVNILSHLEAAIDFPDDAPDTDPIAVLAERLKKQGRVLEELLSGASFGILAKRGVSAVIAGRPNVGKSSIMNELARENRVIVTPFPGTTRDVVEIEVNIRGFVLCIQDTAGIRESEHPIEKEGIERTKQALGLADLVIYVVDASEAIFPEDIQLIRALGDKRKIVVMNKVDKHVQLDVDSLKKELPGCAILRTSCVDKPGVGELEEEIFRTISQGSFEASEQPWVNSLRQKDAVEKSLSSLRLAATSASQNRSPELIAVDVRLALDELGMLVGEVYTDDILEQLFGQFCIGK